jgi:hypothetical protein
LLSAKSIFVVSFWPHNVTVKSGCFLASERGDLPERLDWLWFCQYDLDSELPDHIPSMKSNSGLKNVFRNIPRRLR